MRTFNGRIVSRESSHTTSGREQNAGRCISSRCAAGLRFYWLAALIVSALVSPGLADDTTAVDSALRKIGQAMESHKLINGEYPERLSDLWEGGILTRFEDFLLPDSRQQLGSAADIDQRTDFVLRPKLDGEESAPLVGTRATPDRAQRVLLEDGTVVSRGGQAQSQEPVAREPTTPGHAERGQPVEPTVQETVTSPAPPTSPPEPADPLPTPDTPEPDDRHSEDGRFPVSDEPVQLPVTLPQRTSEQEHIGDDQGSEAWQAVGGRSDADLATLVEQLKHPDPGFRGHAAAQIAEFGPGGATAIPALVEALTDTDESVRAAAAYSFRGIGPVPQIATAMPALISALDDPAAGVRVEAVQTLGAIGFLGDHRERVGAALQRVQTDDEDEFVQLMAGEALASLGF